MKEMVDSSPQIFPLEQTMTRDWKRSLHISGRPNKTGNLSLVERENAAVASHNKLTLDKKQGPALKSSIGI
jgi:hypothetical protein